MRNRFLALFLALLGSTSIFGDEKDVDWKLKSKAARDAIRQYEGSVGKLDTAFEAKQKQLTDAYADKRKKYRLELLVQLEAVLKDAAQAVDLDEANKIRDAIRALHEGAEPTSRTSGKHNVVSQIPAAAVSFKNHHYLAIHMDNITWEKAQDLCKTMGGQLVVIDSTDELGFLNALKGADRNQWIGAANIRGKWRWIDGGPIDERFWHQGGPASLAGANFVYLGGAGWIWNAPSPHKNIPGFICEWDQ